MAQICPGLLIGQMEAGARSEPTVGSAHCARVASDLAKMKSRGMLFWALQRCSILVVKAASENELNAAFATVVRAGAGALLVRGSPLFLTRRRQLVALATRHALLASYSSRDYAEVAGDMRSLVFETPPLDTPIEIVGAAIITLDVASDKPIANLAVRLCDVHPSGESLCVSYGVLNLTHRDGHEKHSTSRREQLAFGTDIQVAIFVECEVRP
jgi:hypothetical protein